MSAGPKEIEGAEWQCMVYHGPGGCPGYPHPSQASHYSGEARPLEVEHGEYNPPEPSGEAIRGNARLREDWADPGWVLRDRDERQRKERRERIATAVLAGFAHDPAALNCFDVNARYALDSADALIKAMDE